MLGFQQTQEKDFELFVVWVQTYVDGAIEARLRKKQSLWKNHNEKEVLHSGPDEKKKQVQRKGHSVAKYNVKVDLNPSWSNPKRYPICAEKNEVLRGCGIRKWLVEDVQTK